MSMVEPHPLVAQLRFARSEFERGIRDVPDDHARIRLGPMNCLSWNIGHLAAHEQRQFLTLPQGLTPFPDIEREFSYGAPGSTPELSRVLDAWHSISAAADPWLDALTTGALQDHLLRDGRPTRRTLGNMLQRAVYHYWFHTGENLAIRQQLGHTELPEFVGDLDGEAPYRPEAPV